MGSSFFDLFSYPNQTQTVLYFYIYAYLGAVVKEIVEQLLNGKYFYAERNLDFSTPRVELYLGAGESVEGSFTIFGSEERLLVGKISSTELRMQVITRDFSGTPYEASYRFDATGLSKGDVIQGDFRIISNQGEYFLPFVVNIRLDHIASSLGDIRNLFHFANLAKTDWKEAVDLFYSDEFISIFSGTEGQYESLYRGLSEIPGNEQNVEEFLIAINKKQPMNFLLDVKEIIDKTEMTEGARNLAKKIFGIVAEAEAAVHDRPIDEVHFHEVGAVDSIVDILSAAVCFDDLVTKNDIKKCIITRLVDGCGTVRCQHGVIPVPVPAVMKIAEQTGVRLAITERRGEYVTPTGAAFAAAVKTDDRLPESFSVLKVGIGAGKRDYEIPGMVRAMIIEA